MKQKTLTIGLAFIMALFTLTACEKDEPKANEEPKAKNNIVEIAQSQPNLSLLVTALTKYPDLVTTLSGAGSYTVFAPTNEAFTALLGVIGQTSINDVPEPILKSLLQYHVVTSGTVLSTQLTASNAAVSGASPSILTTLLNSSKKTLFAPTNDAFIAAGITSLPNQATLDVVLTYHVIGSEIRSSQLPMNVAPANNAVTTLGGVFYLSTRGAAGIFINGKTKVVAADILADNGVVHVIDRTLMPPSQTIAQIATGLSTAASGKEFTQLVAALVRVPALLNEASDAKSNLIVFAPTDAAFSQLYTALGVAGVDKIDINTLTAVLQHHILSAPTTATGRVFSSDLITGSVPTLNGNISINAASGIVTSSGATVATISSNKALINVLGNNGLIHTIDKVLLPGK